MMQLGVERAGLAPLAAYAALAAAVLVGGRRQCPWARCLLFVLKGFGARQGMQWVTGGGRSLLGVIEGSKGTDPRKKEGRGVLGAQHAEPSTCATAVSLGSSPER